MRENCEIPKNIFFSFNKKKNKTGSDLAYPSWAGPDPAHILWAGLSPAGWTGLIFQLITNKRAGYCAAVTPNIIS